MHPIRLTPGQVAEDGDVALRVAVEHGRAMALCEAFGGEVPIQQRPWLFTPGCDMDVHRRRDAVGKRFPQGQRRSNGYDTK